MGRRAQAVDLAGVFRGSVAVAEGAITTRQLRGSSVRRLFRDVYVPAGADVDHRVRCAGAALIAPPDAVISGRSAATLHGVPLAEARDPVHVVIPEDSRFSSGTRRLAVRRAPVRRDECRPWREIWLATAQRTALDLVLARPLLDGVADLDQCLRAGLVDLELLRRDVAQRHDRGIVVARQAVELADPRAESPPESRVRVLLVLGGLDPVPQYVVYGTRGFVARVDLAFPAAKLAVEYDGAWHGDPLRVGPDRERLNRLRAAGWTVIFVTAGMLRDNPGSIVRDVRAALTVRS